MGFLPFAKAIYFSQRPPQMVGFAFGVLSKPQTIGHPQTRRHTKRFLKKYVRDIRPKRSCNGTTRTAEVSVGPKPSQQKAETQLVAWEQAKRRKLCDGNNHESKDPRERRGQTTLITGPFSPSPVLVNTFWPLCSLRVQ